MARVFGSGRNADEIDGSRINCGTMDVARRTGERHATMMTNQGIRMLMLSVELSPSVEVALRCEYVHTLHK